MTGQLEVWEPTEQFLQFLSKNFKYNVKRKNKFDRIEYIIVPQYRSGTYQGIIGLAAWFNGDFI